MKLYAGQQANLKILKVSEDSNSFGIYTREVKARFREVSKSVMITVRDVHVPDM